MRVRVRETNPARPQASQAPLAESQLLALQRTAGNHAVVRMLARDATPSRLDVGPVTDLHKGGTSAEKWGDEVRSREHILDLYAEIATLLNATRIEDVKGTTAKDINTARKPEAGALKQGLNFVGDLGSDRGQTAFLYDGQFNAKLPAEREGALPVVAVALGPRAFDASNKASTLGVLRHELEHAFHGRLALNWLKAWRDDTSSAAKKASFISWLEKKKLPAADLALIRERVGGTRINTEALGNLEQFITQLPFEHAEDKLAHPAYFELEDAAGYWVNADAAVQQEIVARLKALRGRLNTERQGAFDAAMKKLKAGNKAYAPLSDAVLK